MVKPTVYLETSIISYATGRPSRDLIVAARQQITRDWFAHAQRKYELFVSQLVVQEALAGDVAAAEGRENCLKGIPLLATSKQAINLARKLIAGGAVREAASEDSLHIALAAAHGVDFLLTWNFKHIAKRGDASRN